MNKSKKLLVILPSYGRAKKLNDAIASYKENHSEYSDIMFGLVSLDKDLQQSINVIKSFDYNLDDYLWLYGDNGFCRTVNCMVEDNPGYGAYMILNDDQVIQTKDFDKIIMTKIDELAEKYGHRIWIPHWNDTVQGETLCQSFATKEFLEIFKTYYPDKCMRHLYSDNLYHFIGDACGILHYIPEVTIEHRHFVNKKAEIDDTYKQTNSKERYEQDGKAFAEWLNRDAVSVCRAICEAIKKPFSEDDIKDRIKKIIKPVENK